ncbi:Flp family type IVb pilin [Sphingopyxis sp. 550A]
MKFIKKFVRDTKAATAIEYGLIAALIAVAGITAMSAVGTAVSTTFDKVSGNLDGAGSAPTTP